MQRRFFALGQDWVFFDDGAALIRADRLHTVSTMRGSLPPDGAAPVVTDKELADFVAQWTAKRRNEVPLTHAGGYRWATRSNTTICVDMARFGALLTAPGVTVWRAALPGEMAAPLIVRLGEEPIALVAPLED